MVPEGVEILSQSIFFYCKNFFLLRTLDNLWTGPQVRLEAQTDFCWLCERPQVSKLIHCATLTIKCLYGHEICINLVWKMQRLIIPFEMRGYQRVYNLEKKVNLKDKENIVLFYIYFPGIDRESYCRFTSLQWGVFVQFNVHFRWSFCFQIWKILSLWNLGVCLYNCRNLNCWSWRHHQALVWPYRGLELLPLSSPRRIQEFKIKLSPVK